MTRRAEVKLCAAVFVMSFGLLVLAALATRASLETRIMAACAAVLGLMKVALTVARLTKV